MEFNLLKHIEILILPPGSVMLLFIAGLVVWRYSTKWAVGIMISAVLALYLSANPLVARGLVSLLESYDALSEERVRRAEADAIVVLAGGRLSDQPEYQGDTVSHYTLQRLRYGAYLKRRTNLPIILSGGKYPGDHIAESKLMQDVLQKEYAIEVTAIDAESRTTYENALYSAKILKQKGYQRIFLVTHAYHIPRAKEAFEHFGLKVIPAPTVYRSKGRGISPIMPLLPSAHSLANTSAALHELVGLWWYRLRYY